jgi:polysaccharide pyruvyl transferase CsaB
MALSHRKQNNRRGVVICGAYGHGNAGDEAILEALVAQVRSIDPTLDITVLSRLPEETAKKHGVRSIHTFDFRALRTYLKGAALYINGGGSLIQDVTSRRSLLYYLFTLFAAKKSGARVIMYGCGIGPVTRFGDKAVTRWVLNRNVDIITLREPDSMAELASYGVTKPQIILSADPALTLPSASESEINAAMESFGLSPNGKYICFCLRRWRGFEERAHIFAEAADYAREKYALTPVFLSINHRSDGEAADSAAAYMKSAPVILREPMPTGVTIGIMSRMAAVVSMRLHGLIFAAGNGVPLVGVSYDPKVTAFLDYIGEENCFELENLEADALCRAIDRALCDGGREKRTEKAERLALFAQKNVECAKSLLEKTE